MASQTTAPTTHPAPLDVVGRILAAKAVLARGHVPEPDFIAYLLSREAGIFTSLLLDRDLHGDRAPGEVSDEPTLEANDDAPPVAPEPAPTLQDRRKPR